MTRHIIKDSEVLDFIKSDARILGRARQAGTHTPRENVAALARQAHLLVVEHSLCTGQDDTVQSSDVDRLVTIAGIAHHLFGQYPHHSSAQYDRDNHQQVGPPMVAVARIRLLSARVNVDDLERGGFDNQARYDIHMVRVVAVQLLHQYGR